MQAESCIQLFSLYWRVEFWTEISTFKGIIPHILYCTLQVLRECEMWALLAWSLAGGGGGGEGGGEEGRLLQYWSGIPPAACCCYTSICNIYPPPLSILTHTHTHTHTCTVVSYIIEYSFTTKRILCPFLHVIRRTDLLRTAIFCLWFRWPASWEKYRYILYRWPPFYKLDRMWMIRFDKQGLFLYIHVSEETVQRGLDINKVCKSCALFTGFSGKYYWEWSEFSGQCSKFSVQCSEYIV